MILHVMPVAPATTTFSKPDSMKAEPLGSRSTGASCGCGAASARDDGQPAREVDPATKSRNLKRLRRIEGQMRGLQRMIDEDRYCADVMTQISSAHEALRAVGRELMRSHLRHCAVAEAGASTADAEPMYQELIDMMYRLAR